MKTLDLLEPLNGVNTAKIEISSDAGNLTIDKLDIGAPLLASGTLQYEENQQPPTPTLNARNGQATLTLTGRGSGRRWRHLPWDACNAANEWQIHLNPTVASDISAHSGGGNVKLDLTGMAVSHVSADTGGGNMEVVLPGDAPALTIQASSGAGNVVVHVPGGVAAKVHATSGLGKVNVNSRFSPIDRNTYESPGYEQATHQVELTVKTGAGNVSIEST